MHPLHDIYKSRGYIRLDDISAHTIIVNNVGRRGARMFQIKGAMKNNIYRFKPGSPAEILGIQPIDLSNVGSTLAK